MKRITIASVKKAYEFVKLTPKNNVFFEKNQCCAITALVLEKEEISGKNEETYAETLSCSTEVDFFSDDPEEFFCGRLAKYYPELGRVHYLEGFIRGFDDTKPVTIYIAKLFKNEDYCHGIEDGAAAAAEVL